MESLSQRDEGWISENTWDCFRDHSFFEAQYLLFQGVWFVRNNSVTGFKRSWVLIPAHPSPFVTTDYPVNFLAPLFPCESEKILQRICGNKIKVSMHQSNDENITAPSSFDKIICFWVVHSPLKMVTFPPHHIDTSQLSDKEFTLYFHCFLTKLSY